jgi:penicillin-binding protein 1A
MTFTTALQQSINIPAVEALYLAGIKSVIALANNMGITTLGEAKDYGLSFALGAAEVKLLELTSAYGVFANDGVRNPPVGILEVRDAKGNTVEKYEAKPQQAISADLARQMSSILSTSTTWRQRPAPRTSRATPGRSASRRISRWASGPATTTTARW